MRLISDGFFTNSLDTLSPSTSVVPQTSIVAMNLLSKNKFNYSKEIRKMVDSLLSYLDDSTEQKKNSGNPLEIVINRLITAKLAVLFDVFEATNTTQSFSLFSLFQLQQSESEDLKEFMSMKLYGMLNSNSFLMMSGTQYEVVQLSSSYSRSSDDIIQPFLDEVNQVFLEDASFKEIKLIHNDFADGVWMLRTKYGDPFILFVDTKSAQINVRKKQPPAQLTQPCKLSDLPTEGKQASRLHNITELIRALIDVNKGSMADALSNGRYLFVYVNAGQRETFGVGDKILHLGGKDTKSFLSFCAELCVST
mmetsp:Transcript_26784/g.36816  ORF Transcript_26784/g.36816 Transcript_26784/m.36816 type:complete len:308 (+) Transcript_26784:243-1166(+)